MHYVTMTLNFVLKYSNYYGFTCYFTNGIKIKD